MTGDCTSNHTTTKPCSVTSPLFLACKCLCLSNRDVMAHQKNKSLDIGLLTSYNFREIWKAGPTLYLVLRTVATVLHLKSVKICPFDIITPTNFKASCNSTIFQSISFAVFLVALVIDDFLASPDVWSATKFIINSSDIFDRGPLYKAAILHI